ncbi:MAG TPA: FixH family protein [Bacteroidales bacterium]|nr:FixH family protein [Bacteroidales bacterium]HRZ22167.1 FixH family protein [Bacteroidales bacterium]
MNIHFSWGTGLLIFIILFITAVIGFFVFSSYQEFILVEEDYYEKEIGFQQQIDKMNRTRLLAERIIIDQEGRFLTVNVPLTFLQDSVKGTLHFYRPSDARLDEFIPLLPDSSGVQQVDLENFKPGKYILKMNWEMNSLSYYQEQTVIIK